MRIYEYCVHNNHGYEDYIFVKASCYKNAINRAYKEWYDQDNNYHINKRDLRAMRVSKYKEK